MTEPKTSAYSLLDRVKLPRDLRQLPESDLRQLCDEVRRETIDAVSVTGGHLGAGLGVVELTTAIHYIFDTPNDKLIWDVGHQCYPHKILTGRRDRIRTLRQPGGLSGFTKRSESEYDPFGAAHSSTSISAALGYAVGRDLKKQDNHVIAVIGDGAMTGGMAYLYDPDNVAEDYMNLESLVTCGLGHPHWEAQLKGLIERVTLPQLASFSGASLAKRATSSGGNQATIIGHSTWP